MKKIGNDGVWHLANNIIARRDNNGIVNGISVVSVSIIASNNRQASNYNSSMCISKAAVNVAAIAITHQTRRSLSVNVIMALNRRNKLNNAKPLHVPA